MEHATVLVAVDDLFFLSKIQTTLKHLGLSSQVVTQSAALQQQLQESDRLVLLVVDLTLRSSDPIALIRAGRSVERPAPLAILGFGAHVAVDSRQQALQAGADRVVAKSEFSQHLPTLLQEYLLQA